MSARPELGRFDLTMIVISLVIGMGIFRTPVDAAAGAGSPAIFFAAWIVAGLIALCGALTFAEIGSRYPITGGYFRVFSYAYHPSFAFAVTSVVLVANAASVAGVALIGAEYLVPVLAPTSGDPAGLARLIAAASLVLFFALNLLGLRTSARVQNLLTAIKLLLLLGLASALVLAEPATAGSPVAAPPAPPDAPRGAVEAFGLALIATSFTYGGYQQTINFGSEVRDARRVVPQAIGLGLAVIISLYLLLNLTYVRVLGFDALASADSIAAQVAAAAFGEAAGVALSLLLFLAVLGFVNVAMLTNPRLLLAMSEDAALPAGLARVSARTGAPTAALTLFVAVALASLFAAGTFDVILNYTMFLDSIGMAAGAAALFVLRRQTSHLDDLAIYRMRLYPALPLLFIAAYLFIAFAVASADPQAAVRGAGIFAAFAVVDLVARRRRRSPSARPPEP
ncbi:MAG: amino acid permease [Myxococcales bacterium]|nr:amino acid permease [Myxococcales bacterium]